MRPRTARQDSTAGNKRRSVMPDPKDEKSDADEPTESDEEARTGEEQAAINRENDPPA